MTTNLLIPLDDGPEALLKEPTAFIRSIGATMTHFPLCCSTGVLNNMTAEAFTKYYSMHITQKTPIRDINLDSIRKATTIHDLLKPLRSSAMFFPREVAEWNAMSLILAKSTTGRDDQGTGGYRNYKAAQIIMCDRICEDKRNPKFNFNSYNIVYSIDQFMDWLEAQEGKYGEVLISTAKPGGHGARVRACIFTPDIPAVQKYHDERLETLRAHILAYLAWAKPVTGKPVDKVAAMW